MNDINELAYAYKENMFEIFEQEEQFPELLTYEMSDGRRVVYELIEIEE